ncbi:MAG: ROK family protein [Candidatus Limnocylindria bacterium]
MIQPRPVVGQRSETVRRSNLSAIVQALHLRGPLSRSELVRHTGLTRSAIRGLIGELVSGGLVGETRNPPSGVPGRPSALVHPSPDGAAVLALEVNVDSLAAAHVGLGGAINELVRVDRPRAHVTVDEIVADLADLAMPILSSRDHGLVGIGVAVAGVVRRGDGLVRLAPNLGWKDVPLGTRLAAALGADAPMAVANEADLGGLAEQRRGAAVGEDDVLYVAGEVGVGGNVIVDGRPLVGAAGYAGEIGHMIVNPGGAPCACGSFGCWETVIGERAMLVGAGRPPYGGRAAVDELVEAAMAGEPAAATSVASVGEWLGVGVASLVNALNPTLVVLGGVLGRIHPLIAAQLEAALDRGALPASRQLVRVTPGALGVDAPIIGAAELAFEPMIADPAVRLGASRSALASA